MLVATTTEPLVTTPAAAGIDAGLLAAFDFCRMRLRMNASAFFLIAFASPGKVFQRMKLTLTRKTQAPRPVS